ncbi:hypothetical protein CPB83DRAFT_890250 [Crepidotus variabilis]|uniref:Uncharacterized protein n=1 Tax=Crepidotus variabilis TaxID=179855 RepID=A0A9P6EPQ1_9AGAR|nr:hypothetical protein CPB83DRAFT_832216 [Crepidotus variabilis]KAF9533128.1 hypothetical protein CPB83DRAFT_890250 [Crepidotus variabilis]
MATYNILVNIKDKALEDLTKNGSKLCMAKAVIDANGKETYNVVAYANIISFANTITFVDSYSMLGTIQTFKKGDTVMTASSKTLSIQFEQAYSLPSWDKAFVGSDPDVPKASFGFFNGVKASAVVTLKGGPYGGGDDGMPNCPIFISPNPEVPGKTFLTPINKIALWFQHGLKTATMISLSTSDVHIIDLTGSTSAVTTYTDDYKWVDGKTGLTSAPVNYLEINAALAIEDKAPEAASD